MPPPGPELRRRVRALLEDAWGEPATVVFLEEVRPEYRVAGRRRDGTPSSGRAVGRSVWNALRAAAGGVVSVVVSVAGGGAVDVFAREGRVTGPRDAQALGLVDAARLATAPWLVFSRTHTAVVDTGGIRPGDGRPPRVVWHAQKPDAPLVSRALRRMTWPDGSVFHFHVSATESRAPH